jgi:O-acetyl-ADP-ribose deacetylase (regulator of RNase III)
MPTAITAELGDITQQRVDAIVNAANESLLGGGGGRGEPERLASCYRSVFALAKDRGDIRSIASPAISTGIYGYPVDEATEVAVRETRAFVAANPDALDRVVFVCFGDAALQAYQKVLART